MLIILETKHFADDFIKIMIKIRRNTEIVTISCGWQQFIENSYTPQHFQVGHKCIRLYIINTPFYNVFCAV
jgi:phenylpropionate dioxygenase-like ring-hydroxylating dioxygenase large terminal subunit